MGGSDDDDNIVYLTREEHIQAHEELYEIHKLDADRRAALLLKYGVDCPEIKEWRKENNSKAAIEAHKVKLENGFYDKLGKLNSERLQGTTNESHSNTMKQYWEDNQLVWWNDGYIEMRAVESPGENWKPGRITSNSQSLKETYKQNPPLWWNNGIINTRCSTKPGDDWVRGKLKKYKYEANK